MFGEIRLDEGDRTTQNQSNQKLFPFVEQCFSYQGVLVDNSNEISLERVVVKAPVLLNVYLGARLL